MQQLYKEKPTKLSQVRGESSKTVFMFMKTGEIYERGYCVVWDVDDYERVRALLICYPKWKLRMSEMDVISEEWKALVTNWDRIEELYCKDYEKYGNMAYNEGQCDKYIRSLLKI